jgi:hypothetical protein
MIVAMLGDFRDASKHGDFKASLTKNSFCSTWQIILPRTQNLYLPSLLLPSTLAGIIKKGAGVMVNCKICKS